MKLLVSISREKIEPAKLARYSVPRENNGILSSRVLTSADCPVVTVSVSANNGIARNEQMNMVFERTFDGLPCSDAEAARCHRR